MCNELISVAGSFLRLLFTHNTLISVLYSIITSTNSRYLRCCSEDGHVINKGAQFRYGLDGQYGDVIFVMKPDFWKGMRGVSYHGEMRTDHVVAGHFHEDDFVEYTGEGNTNLIDGWHDVEALFYELRRPAMEGERIGLGKECKGIKHAFSWCNIQLHVGENVNFTHVAKVYVPAWVVYDTITMERIEFGGINTTLLRQLVTNQLPHYPTGDRAPNPLNGLFHLYGPRLAHAHYYLIQKERHKIEDDAVSHHTYTAIEAEAEISDLPPQSVPTYRHARHSTSTVFLHEKAFRDAEIKYMADVVESGMSSRPRSVARNLSLCAPYQYNQDFGTQSGSK